jgi:hypothetical protein
MRRAQMNAERQCRIGGLRTGTIPARTGGIAFWGRSGATDPFEAAPMQEAGEREHLP